MAKKMNSEDILETIDHLTLQWGESINSPDDLNEPNFVKSLTSVNNIYKKDTHSRSKHAILIAGDYVFDGTKNKRFSKQSQSVKSDVLVELQ